MIIVSGNTLTFKDKSYRCAIGKSGMTDDKKEGDGCTPKGTFLMRECWYRMDRMDEPKTKLPVKIIRPEDGWCDDPAHPSYNRHVALPFDAHHENLFREDHIYDLIIPLGYNDDPVIPGKGSAIFMHLAHEDYTGTEGCIVLAKQDLLEILKTCNAETQVAIS